MAVNEVTPSALAHPDASSVLTPQTVTATAQRSGGYQFMTRVHDEVETEIGRLPPDLGGRRPGRGRAEHVGRAERRSPAAGRRGGGEALGEGGAEADGTRHRMYPVGPADPQTRRAGVQRSPH